MDGKPYRVAVRLYAIAEARWTEVEFHFHAIDLIRQPAHRFCNLILGWCLAQLTPEKRQQWEFEMAAPLPWESEMPRPTAGDHEQDLADFLAATSSL